MGIMALGKEGRPGNDKIVSIARHWMLGLEFSNMFSASAYLGRVAARQTIYDKIKKFNIKELKMLIKAVIQVELDEEIPESHLRKLMNENSFWFEA